MEIYRENSTRFGSQDCLYDLLKRRAGAIFKYQAKIRKFRFIIPITVFILSAVTGLAKAFPWFIPVLFLLGPMFLMFVDFIVLLPRLTRNIQLDEVLVTPVKNKQFVDSIANIANDINVANMKEFMIYLIILSVLFLIFNFDSFMIAILLMLPMAFFYILQRQMLLLLGTSASLAPRMLYENGAIYTGTGLYYFAMVTCAVLTGYLYSTTDGFSMSRTILVVSYQIILFLGLTLPSAMSENFVKFAMRKRRQGEWL